MQGFAQQMLHLANPVFDGMTFVKGDKGAGCRVWPTPGSSESLCWRFCRREGFGEPLV